MALHATASVFLCIFSISVTVKNWIFTCLKVTDIIKEILLTLYEQTHTV